ncbi:alpha/beta hydrolase [bacterium]|nr:alpha/beta hydrolase [bacterium]
MKARRHEVHFLSGGISCAGWHYPAAGECCIVMGHGLGGIRESGLAAYAERFAQAGFVCLVFDYRHFGDSQGEPRQLGSIPRQLEDWRSAIQFARQLPGVRKVVLWGTSFSGGHVVVAASRDPEVAAVIAQNPMLDGRSAFVQAAGRVGPWMVLRTVAVALLDSFGALLGRLPRLLPVAAPPGSLGFLTAPDSLPGYLALSPAYARNELAARLALTTASYRPIHCAHLVRCPVLLQICERDSVAPPAAALATAQILGPRGRVESYPIGHFDIYFGDHFERAVGDQIHFLRHCLS